MKSVVIIGGGSIGERHLRCFLAGGQAEVSVCEVNASLRRAVAERYSVKQTFETCEAALASRPDAVVICTPAPSHVALATQAVKQGAHALIEKPLSTTPAGVAELDRELADRRLVCAVAYVYRAHPALAAMRAAIQGGRFGEPVQIVATAGQNFPFYRPDFRKTYYRSRETGGGAVQDALTHIVNAAEWLVGPTDHLVADLDHQLLEGVTVEDTVHVLTRHKKVMGCFSLNQHQAPNETTITVICQRGVARFEYHNSRWHWADEPGGRWHDEPSPVVERDTLFTRQAEAFLAAVDGESPPLCSLAEAVQTLRVNLAILDSAETRGWKTIKTETMLYV